MRLALLAALLGCSADPVDDGCDAEQAVRDYRAAQHQRADACGVWLVTSDCRVEQLDPPEVEGRHEGGCVEPGQRIINHR